jgi:hypothetical protein
MLRPSMQVRFNTRVVSQLDGKLGVIHLDGHTSEQVNCWVEGFQAPMLFWIDELIPITQ